LKTVSIFFEILNEGWITHLLQISNTHYTGGTGDKSQESCAMGLGFKSCNIFRSPNFLGISNIFVKVFVVVENCLYIF
jgi:hypothetical protein